MSDEPKAHVEVRYWADEVTSVIVKPGTARLTGSLLARMPWTRILAIAEAMAADTAEQHDVPMRPGDG